jgi:hypothetical protein
MYFSFISMSFFHTFGDSNENVPTSSVILFHCVQICYSTQKFQLNLIYWSLIFIAIYPKMLTVLLLIYLTHLLYLISSITLIFAGDKNVQRWNRRFVTSLCSQVFCIFTLSSSIINKSFTRTTHPRIKVFRFCSPRLDADKTTLVTSAVPIQPVGVAEKTLLQVFTPDENSLTARIFLF